MARQTRKSVRSGFTMIEVSLATALLSVLLIAIAVITTNIISIYQKGITMKNLNSVGRNLLDDIETAINSSLPVETINENTFKEQYHRNSDDTNAGVFCTGQYSYIWANPNYNGGNGMTLRYNNGTSKDKDHIRLLKIKDPRRQVCIASDNINNSAVIDIRQYWYNGTQTNYTITDEPEELLSANEVNLYVYNFTVNGINGESDIGINQSTIHTGEVFFSGSFTLGTDRGVHIDTNLSESRCENPSDNEDFNYCAVNTFKFAARTAGKVEK